jgi:hypothetical protein
MSDKLEGSTLGRHRACVFEVKLSGQFWVADFETSQSQIALPFLSESQNSRYGHF